MSPFPNCNLAHRESAFLNPPPLCASENPFLCWLTWSIFFHTGPENPFTCRLWNSCTGHLNTQFFNSSSDLFWWCCGVEISLCLAKQGFEPFHVFMLAQLFLMIKGDNKTTVDQVSITEKLQIIFTWLFFTVFWSRNWQKCFMVKQSRQVVYMKTTCEKTCENKFLVFPASTAVSICHLKLNNFFLTIFFFFTKTD